MYILVFCMYGCIYIGVFTRVCTGVFTYVFTSWPGVYLQTYLHCLAPRGVLQLNKNVNPRSNVPEFLSLHIKSLYNIIMKKEIITSRMKHRIGRYLMRDSSFDVVSYVEKSLMNRPKNLAARHQIVSSNNSLKTSSILKKIG